MHCARWWAAVLQTQSDGARLLQATSGSSGPAACLLARQLLDGGHASTAWTLLAACLPAAWHAEPAAVEAVVQGLFKEQRYPEVRASRHVWPCELCCHPRLSPRLQ